MRAAMPDQGSESRDQLADHATRVASGQGLAMDGETPVPALMGGPFPTVSAAPAAASGTSAACASSRDSEQSRRSNSHASQDPFQQLQTNFVPRTEGLPDVHHADMLRAQAGKEEQNQQLINDLHKEASRARRAVTEMRVEMDEMKRQMSEDKLLGAQEAAASEFDVLPEIALKSAQFRVGVEREKRLERERQGQFPPKKPPTKRVPGKGPGSRSRTKLVPEPSIVDSQAPVGRPGPEGRVLYDLPPPGAAGQKEDPDFLKSESRFVRSCRGPACREGVHLHPATDALNA
jgi:hypothetical protein